MRKLLLASSLLALAVSVAVPSARAAYTVTLTQEGSNVVVSGNGTIDTDGLRFITGGFSSALMVPSISVISTGPASPNQYDEYSLPDNSGPRSFGGGGGTFASSGSGDYVAIDLLSGLIVPRDYVSGAALTGSSTYDNQTFSSLGVTPGAYTWTWGSGATADSFTLDIPAASVPEPASLALLGTGLTSLGLIRRRRRR